MKKMIMAVLVMWAMAFALLYYVGKEFKKEQEHYNSFLGKDYVLNNDTLQIIDYSGFLGTYTLSNGVEINSKLVAPNQH